MSTRFRRFLGRLANTRRRQRALFQIRSAAMLFCIFVALYLLSQKLTNRPSAPVGLISQHDAQHSAVFTPFKLTPGGGEKVVLTFARKFQELTGGHVDLLVKPRNVCKRLKCVRELARALAVDGIDWARLSVKVFSRARPWYNIWFTIGNTLIPKKSARGRTSIYHCQFPFDMGYMAHPFSGLRQLSTYDVVYLNSEYTKTWYDRQLESLRMGVLPLSVSSQRYIDQYTPAIADGMFLPPRTIYYAPAFTKRFKKASSTRGRGDARKRAVRIVLIGRFFTGHQGKCHLAAIEAFSILRKNIAASLRIELHILGYVLKGFQPYVLQVKRRARSVEGVFVKDDATETEMRDAIENGDIVWSITGLCSEEFIYSPADAEHFGIGLLESMSAGLIPVVVDRGGPSEILRGFLDYLKVTSTEELAASTRRIISAGQDELNSLRTMTMKRADKLSMQFDEASVKLFTIFGQRLTPQNTEVWFTLRTRVRRLERGVDARVKVPRKVTRCSSVHADSNALIYFAEGYYDFALRAILTILSRKLGKYWRLHVWHERNNGDFVRESLFDFDCVVYHSYTSEHPRSAFAVDNRTQSIKNPEDHPSSISDVVGKKVERLLLFNSKLWFPPKGVYKDEWTELGHSESPFCHPQVIDEVVQLEGTRSFEQLVSLCGKSLVGRKPPSKRSSRSEGNFHQERAESSHKSSDEVIIHDIAASCRFGSPRQNGPDTVFPREYGSHVAQGDIFLPPFAVHSPFEVFYECKRRVKGARIQSFVDFYF
eukprot:6222-Pelagococcus_subviridis.AAC.1